MRQDLGQFAALATLAVVLMAIWGCKDDGPAVPSAPPSAAPETAARPVPPQTVPAPSPPETAPALETGAGDAYFAVLDLVTCEDVVLRQCRGERWRFPAGTKRVWAHMTVRSLEMKDRVTVRWLQGSPADGPPGGQTLRQQVRLHVGQNPRWRTWAFLDLPTEDAAGPWTVEVLRANGEMMARRRFWVEGVR